MANRICIDVGNTRYKIAVFDHCDAVIHFESFLEFDPTSFDKIIDVYGIVSGIICSTRNINEDVIHHISSKMNLFNMDQRLVLPITLTYKTPKTLGKDRLAAVVAASTLYPNQNNIIIDAGTCMTFDFVDSAKTYHGGNIAPGIRMRLRAMNAFTAKLPLVEPRLNEDFLGKTTEEALQNGAVRGAIFEFESFIDHINKYFGKSNVILTGGDAIYFEDTNKNKIFAHSSLVLEGLNEILKINDK
jgi:type III pantothenate kinase